MSQPLQNQGMSKQNDAGVLCADTRPRRFLPPIKAHALWAATYDNDPNPLLALEERELMPLLPDLEGAFVLDVACGTGRWLNRLLGRGIRRGVGIDLSPEMLAQARRKQALYSRLVCADCTAMPIASGIADLALCSFAVSYVARLERFASELSRVVRKGGRLILTDFHPSCHRRGWRRTFRHMGGVVEILDFQYSIGELCAAFQVSGFDLESILSPSFGEAERTVFRKCGKEHLFEKAREGPAIMICRFRLGNSRPLGKGP
jgi:ubiquinone/menaquinone biosynthesis C-methylase UbiE